MNKTAPDHLSPSAREWFDTIVKQCPTEEHHRRLILLAAQAWDKAEEARKILEKEGIIYHDRFGAPRPHPAVAIERNAQIAFLRMVRALNFNSEEIKKGPGRPGGGPKI